MELLFEHVYTIDEWNAGPRAGVANFAGAPHFFRAVSPDSSTWSADEERFELIPLSPELLAMMLEASALFHRWHPGPRTGKSPAAAQPGATGDRARYADLERQIADALAARLPVAVMRGQFDFDPDRVRWAPIGSGRARRSVSQNN
jgi:hypothetical protein